MRIMVNGNPEKILPCSILDFVNSKGLSKAGLVVEHNYHIVKMDQWETIQLKEDDNLEILSFVGGG